MRRDVTLLQIIDLTNGRWKFDLRSGMNDDEVRTLLNRLRFIEKELLAQLKTKIVQTTDTVEFITKK
jgi:hypothetical protein